MYMPSQFETKDAAAIQALMRAHPFAALIGQDGDGQPFATHLPMLHVEDGTTHGHLIGHVARANQHWRLFGSAAPALAIFAGPNAYISPTWYASDDMVPTWNYQAVHVYGRPVPVADDHAALNIVVRLSARFEVDLPKPWTIDKMTPGKALAMMKGIVAFTMPIERIEAKSKMGQNRSDADRLGAAAALEGRGGEAHLAVAAAMRTAG